jgi:urease accessory protein
MLVQNKIGHLSAFEVQNRTVDVVELKWFELSKRILLKTTKLGTEIAIQFLDKNPQHTQGDILFANDNTIIVVEVADCDCIIIHPKNVWEVAAISYEIGNMHLPLFVEGALLLTPFENPLFNLLHIQGYDVQQQVRKLLYPLKSTVAPHTLNANNITVAYSNTQLK